MLNLTSACKLVAISFVLEPGSKPFHGSCTYDHCSLYSCCTLDFAFLAVGLRETGSFAIAAGWTRGTAETFGLWSKITESYV